MTDWVRFLLALILLIKPIASQIIRSNASHHDSYMRSHSNSSSLADDPDIDNDPTNMHWIDKWGAIGDSFTAGIGAGSIWSPDPTDRQCSRYDRSYVALLHRHIGPSPKTFQWLACTGAKSDQILDQARRLGKDMDLVVMTAGGNDLCMTDVLKNCIFLAYSQSDCDTAIARAKTNMDHILEPALEDILRELEYHMKPSTGVVVFVSYAQFFHAREGETDVCATNQDWSFPANLGGPFKNLQVTLERRKAFNEVVTLTNQRIEKVIDKVKEKGVKYRLHFANWDDWASDDRVAGQFCWPGSTGEYPDPQQHNLHFFKPDTKKRSKHDDLKKREAPADERKSEPVIQETNSLYDSRLDRTVNPAMEVLHKLDGRAPVRRAGCHTDVDVDKRSFGSGLPDRWGKFFHPNELGHITIASFALAEIITARASVLDVGNPICSDEDRDKFRCNVRDRQRLRYYVQKNLVDKTYKVYCQDVRPRRQPNWQDERVFYKNTPEEHKFSIKLMKGATQYSEQECINSFLKIIHSCDIYRDDNPLSFKHGGLWKKGRYIYELSLGKKARPWPVARQGGTCEGWYKVLLSRYRIKGRLWGTLGNGEALRAIVKECIGGGLTNWEFKYFEESDQDDMEWEATFNTPIWVRHRCFANNKVFRAVGGPNIGCGGND